MLEQRAILTDHHVKERVTDRTVAQWILGLRWGEISPTVSDLQM